MGGRERAGNLVVDEALGLGCGVDSVGRVKLPLLSPVSAPTRRGGEEERRRGGEEERRRGG